MNHKETMPSDSEDEQGKFAKLHAVYLHRTLRRAQQDVWIINGLTIRRDVYNSRTNCTNGPRWPKA